jgi:formate-dependent nitrite reductase cytochrome c552 subunit
VARGIDPQTGKQVTIDCVTCHATRTPNYANQATTDLDLFHQGLQLAHGGNTCLSCHNPQDYGSLHLANNSRVEFTDVVTLCSQCHGPQWRDYQHGAHGGMTGSWDVTKGPRERQGCTSCHDPHAPAFRGGHPVLKPKDRFLESTHE